MYGLPTQNQWSMIKRIETELFPLLVKHAHNKPCLIFCVTRKCKLDIVFGVVNRLKSSSSLRKVGRLGDEGVSGS